MGVGNIEFWKHVAWIMAKSSCLFYAFLIAVVLVHFFLTRGKGYDR